MQLVVVLVGGSAATAGAQPPSPFSEEVEDFGPARQRRLVQKLETAREWLASRNPDEKPNETQALRLLQSLLDETFAGDDSADVEDVFLSRVGDVPADAPVPSLRSEARRLIGEMSPNGRQAYELMVGKAARVQLDEALASGDWRSIEDVSRRYFHTAAGYAATMTLALRDLDSGNPWGARQQLAKLFRWPAARVVLEPTLSLRLAVACRLAGANDECRTVLIELKKFQGNRPVPRGEDTLALFSQDSDALAWLDRWVGVALQPRTVRLEQLREWPLPSGNVNRNALAARAVPARDANWSQLLLADSEEKPEADADSGPSEALTPRGTSSPTALEGVWGPVLTELRNELEHQREIEMPVVPAAQPIVVGGAVIVRTLSQVRAFGLSDGRPLWHSAMIEPRLLELLGDRRRGGSQRMPPELEAWLPQRLFEDIGQGTISSDGESIFALQEREGSLRSPPMAWRGLLVTREVNKLVAIEARTGRLLWEVGGPRGDYELTGAGAFFLGPPLPWRGQLFALVEDGIDVRLVSLNPRDGSMLWTQTLATSDPLWSGRVRDAGLSPTAAADCLVCPTGSGKIVAVDPVRRELRWECRYRDVIERLPQRNFNFHPQPVEFELSWLQGTVVASGDRVLITSPDSYELLCLDVRDGRVLWRQPREKGLFLAGIAELSEPSSDAVDAARKTERRPATELAALVVGSHDVKAVRLTDGRPGWARSTSIAPPAGRGVLIDGVLHLPLISGEIASIETRSGRLLARTELSKKEILGNLVAADGRLVSLSPTHVASFPALPQRQQAIAAALEKNPNDNHALEQRGRIRLQLGDRDGGLADLRRAMKLGTLSADAKQAIVSLLLEDVRSGEASDLDSAIQELEKLLDDPQQRLLFVRLRAASLQRRGQPLAAARELLKATESWRPSDQLEIVHGSTLSRPDRWFAAEFSELLREMPPSDREALQADTRLRLKAALEATGPTPLRDFITLFSWSDSIGLARRELIDRIDPHKQRHEFEALLFALRADANGTRHQDTQAIERDRLAAFATARLAQQWLSLGQVEMSRPLIDDLATRFANQTTLDGKSGAELAAQWRTDFAEQLTASWPAQPIRTEVVSNSEPLNQWYHIDWSAPLEAPHEDWQLWRDTTGRAIVARDRFGREQWRTKLPLENYSTTLIVGLSATWKGRWLVLNLGERFMVLDTLPPVAAPASKEDKSEDKPDADAALEPRLLWQNVLYDRRSDHQVTPLPLRHPAPIAGMPEQYRIKDASGRPFGQVAIVGTDIVCHQAGSRLIASQLSNGDPLWVFDGLPAGCDLSGDDRAVVATAPDGREMIVFSALDGRLLSRREIGTAPRLTTVGRNVLTWSGTELRLFDAVSQADLLRVQFPQGTLPCLSLSDAVAMLEPSGRFTLWSLRDGQRQLEQFVPPIAHLTHFVVLRDRERWLLLTNVEPPAPPEKPQPRVSLLGFGSWRVHGPAFAFDRATAKLLWSSSIEWQGVHPAQPADCPVLLLAARVQSPSVVNIEPGNPAKFQVAVLDKRDGKVQVLARNLRPDQRNFADIRPNLANHSIDVQIERELHRLTFGEPAK